MCGRINVTDDPRVCQLMEVLGLPLYPSPNPNIAPLSTIQIVKESDSGRELVDAIWSMLIEPHPDGPGYRAKRDREGRPYSTFNARARTLSERQTWKRPLRTSRCIVPVTGFYEWKDGHCYFVSGGEGMALAGLYRVYHFGTVEVHAAAVITLSGQPGFSHIHAKSYPLILDPLDFHMWLDPLFTSSDFEDLRSSGIRSPVLIQPVKSPTDHRPTGEAEYIAATQVGASGSRT